MIYIWSIMWGIIIAELLVLAYYELPIQIYMFIHRKDKLQFVMPISYSEKLNDVICQNVIGVIK